MSAGRTEWLLLGAALIVIAAEIKVLSGPHDPCGRCLYLGSFEPLFDQAETAFVILAVVSLAAGLLRGSLRFTVPEAVFSVLFNPAYGLAALLIFMVHRDRSPSLWRPGAKATDAPEDADLSPKAT